MPNERSSIARLPVTRTAWRRRLWSLGFAGYALLLCPATGSADPAPEPKLELVWQVPPECPNRESILAKANELLAGRGTRMVAAEGSIVPSDTGYELVLSAQAGEAELTRRLEGRDCLELGDAAALILAMAARPSPASAASTAESSDSPAAPSLGAESADVERSETAPSSAPFRRNALLPFDSSRERRWHSGGPPLSVELMVGSLADMGTLPSTTLSLAGGVGIRRDTWALEAEYRYWLERDEDVVSGKGGVMSLSAGGLQGCWTSPLMVEACAGLEAGRLAGDPYGTVEQHARSVLWLAGRVSGRFALVKTSWLRLGGLIEAAVPLRHYEFRLEHVGSETVHRPWYVCPRAGVWGALSFGDPM